MKKSILLLIILFLTSCASTKQTLAFKSPEEKTTEGKSTVCVIRPRTFFGSGVSTLIYQDNKIVGKLGHANYLCWESEPGSHVLQTKAENKKELHTNFQPNQKYFYQLKYSMGVVKARASLEEISQEEFSKFSLESKK